MVSLTYIWSLAFLYGVLGESPTYPPSDNEPDPSTLEHSTFSTGSDYRKIDFESLFDKNVQSLGIADQMKEHWEPYSSDVYPLFKKAVKELASSERGILIFWDFLNSPESERPREFYEKIFRAYNHMVDDFPSSTTTEEADTTIYNLDFTEPEVSVSEVHSRKERVDDTEEASETTMQNLNLIETGVSESVSDVRSRKERVDETEEANEAAVDNLDLTEADVSEAVSELHYGEEPVVETEDADTYYHTSISSDEDEVEVYYSTENPETEVVVLDESYYTSGIIPEQRGATEFDMGDQHRDSSTETEVETVESHVVTSESGMDDVIRRSGVLVEENHPAETDSSSLPLRIGSIRGIPCENFPCYEEIPITSFTCADKRVPGIYADLETGCQVFHVCWHNRRESFLCPIGTTFNQPITACDYWYSSNCSLSSLYLESTTEPQKIATPPGCKKTTCTPQTTETSSTEQTAEKPFLDEDWFRNSKFVPVKTKVTVYFKPKEHAKHSTSKKTVPKIAKPKQDVIPLVEDFLKLAEIVTKDAVKILPKVVEAEIIKSKLVGKPAAKLEPCLKIKDHHKPKPPVVKEPKPLPTLNPRFIVKPVPKPLDKIHHKKENKFIPKILVKQIKPLGVHKTKVHHDKEYASEIVLKALEAAGDVFQRDILTLTRKAMSEDNKPKH